MYAALSYAVGILNRVSLFTQYENAIDDNPHF